MTLITDGFPEDGTNAALEAFGPILDEAFRNPIVAAYFAALTPKTLTTEQLTAVIGPTP